MRRGCLPPKDQWFRHRSERPARVECRPALRKTPRHRNKGPQSRRARMIGQLRTVTREMVVSSVCPYVASRLPSIREDDAFHGFIIPSLVFRLINLIFGRARTGFKVNEIMARMPYQAWDHVAYSAITHYHNKEQHERKHRLYRFTLIWRKSWCTGKR